MQEIFIFGHKKPDTDSVSAAIVLSHLKNKLGQQASPKILDPINRETEFVLDYFKISQPEYLNDVKLKIKDISYQREYYLLETDSIYSSYLYMNENHISSIPVVDSEQTFIGMVSIKDIAKYQILNHPTTLRTSYKNLIETLNANEILKFNHSLEGELLRERNSQENTHNNSIVMIYERGDLLNYCLSKGVKVIILTNNFSLSEEELKKAREKEINVVETKMSLFEVANTIYLANDIITITTNNKLVYFKEDTTIEEFIEIANTTKYSNYPIIDDYNKCLGTLKLSDLGKTNPKKVILVDHNELEQSVDGLEDAEILEIIDHHKIGVIGTKEPISFRNVPVGSTNTILYMMYQENKIEITKEIAGLMMSGILSDTLLLTSPTTTNVDKDTIVALEPIAGVQYYEYGMKMFEAGSSLAGKTKEEILYTDFKNFTIQDKKVGIGQIFTMSTHEMKEEVKEYSGLLNEIAKNNNYELVALFITDVIHNGSYVLFNQKAQKIMAKSFEIEDITQFTYLADCVSRKKQIIPNIMKAMEK